MHPIHREQALLHFMGFCLNARRVQVQSRQKGTSSAAVQRNTATFYRALHVLSSYPHHAAPFTCFGKFRHAFRPTSARRALDEDRSRDRKINNRSTLLFAFPRFFAQDPSHKWRSVERTKATYRNKHKRNWIKVSFSVFPI